MGVLPLGGIPEHRGKRLGAVDLLAVSTGQQEAGGLLTDVKRHFGHIFDGILHFRPVIELDGHCLHQFGVGIGTGGHGGGPEGQQHILYFHIQY